jgi:hypothetical protein
LRSTEMPQRQSSSRLLSTQGLPHWQSPVLCNQQVGVPATGRALSVTVGMPVQAVPFLKQKFDKGDALKAELRETTVARGACNRQSPAVRPVIGMPAKAEPSGVQFRQKGCLKGRALKTELGITSKRQSPVGNASKRQSPLLGMPPRGRAHCWDASKKQSPVGNASKRQSPLLGCFQEAEPCWECLQEAEPTVGMLPGSRAPSS